MLKITVKEKAYAGHGTTGVHTYELSEGLLDIYYNKYDKEVVVKFDSCSDDLKFKVDGRVTAIIIED